MSDERQRHGICKLCGGVAEYRFSKTLMKQTHVDYHRCRQCDSLQILQTDFLPEAYRNQNWALDTGLVARNLLLAAKLSQFLVTFVDPKDLIIDYGGGTGLLTRLLRDMGWNAFVYDKFGKPLFVDAFHLDSIDDVKCKVIIASEVFEHFDKPKEEVDYILRRTNVLFFTTELYDGQDESWWYFAPFTGQHVFFWSRKAIINAFDTHGFQFLNCGFFKLGLKNELMADNMFRLKVMGWMSEAGQMYLSNSSLRPIKNYLAEPFKFVVRDYPIEVQKFYQKK